MRLILLALNLALCLVAPAALAQGQFSPVIRVNDSAITGYELDQRIKFLTLLRFPGDIRAEAEKGLIEDRLRLALARSIGMKLTDQQIEAGMAEFAGRANLETEQFLQAIAQGGVDPETFRDFVEAGIAWREVVRARYAGRVTVSEAEIDRALSADNGRGAGPRVLLSEIILRARPGETGVVRRRAEKLVAETHGEAAFAALAREMSLAPSREDGGRIDWIPLSNLPPQAQAAIGKLGQGQISEPVPLNGYVALFLLRGMTGGEDKLSASAIASDYAVLALGAGQAAEAQRIATEARSCDDLYLLTKGQSGAVNRQNALRGQIPGDIAGTLDRLDANEAAVVQGASGPRVVMLCSRNATIAANHLDAVVPVIADPAAKTAGGDIVPSAIEGLGFGNGPSRDQIRDEIQNRKLAQLADSWLAELKAGAIITRP